MAAQPLTKLAFTKLALTGSAATGLRSFRRDWDRWSLAEKACALMALALVAILLTAPVAVALS